MPSGEGKATRRREAVSAGSQHGGRVGPAAEPGSDQHSVSAILASLSNIETARPESLDIPRAFNLARMQRLMEVLGNPQSLICCVHVAGSKGKGSVCEMTASCLEACGYTVGVYTSPHLVDLRERIRINRDMISREQFAAVIRRVHGAASQLPADLGPASLFEVLTAAAFVHFAEMAVDIALIEVGMGGRLDATNIIRPAVCAISQIQLEHTAVLGDTLEKIAAEKAGIMKPGVPCVTVPQTDGVMAQLRAAAASVGTTLEQIGKDIEFSYRVGSSPELGPHARVVLTTQRSNFEHLPVPLRGEHQAVNCGLALAILDKLRGASYDTPEPMVAQGLARTPARGRLELIHERPRIFVDGAHTPDSIAAVIRAVSTHVKYDSLVVVFGCAADKDVPRMLEALATGADKVFFTRATDHARAADPRDLQRRFAESSSKMTQIAPTVRDALNLAARAVQRDDLILVVGSFVVAGEAKRLLAERNAARREEAIREVKPSGIAPQPGERRRRP